MEDCIFCKIATGKIPCAKLHESKEILAFLDIAPANKGHCLVIPKKHLETITEIPDALLSKMITAVKELTARIDRALKPDGFNIINNNKKPAGQLVPHFHIHVIPRFINDGQEITWKANTFDGEYMEKIRQIILTN
ncbi:HIT family protein [Candidatus Woesearchaeota archaeon]|nr:HIT family protein [Candidatus Woesearchaeota archaeon]